MLSSSRKTPASWSEARTATVRPEARRLAMRTAMLSELCSAYESRPLGMSAGSAREAGLAAGSRGLRCASAAPAADANLSALGACLRLLAIICSGCAASSRRRCAGGGSPCRSGGFLGKRLPHFVWTLTAMVGGIPAQGARVQHCWLNGCLGIRTHSHIQARVRDPTGNVGYPSKQTASRNVSGFQTLAAMTAKLPMICRTSNEVGCASAARMRLEHSRKHG